MNFKNIQQLVRTFSLTEGEDGVILPAAKTTPSIAVLPFANMSHDAGDEYFSDGLAEEIINALAQVSGLKVIARTSAFAFKGKNEDIRKIAETLGVVNVLEGSVRRAENRLSVTAQLIQAQDGSHLWSHRYDREMTDVFAMQDEIATAITDALRVKLFASHHRYEPTLPSYEAYLKALYYGAKETPESLDKSKKFYEQAVALDPNFALGYVGLADHLLRLVFFAGFLPAHEAVPQIRALVNKALDIDYTLPEAHAMLAIVAARYDYDWQQAQRLFGVAMSHHRIPAWVRVWYAYFFLLPNAQYGSALSYLERALKEDPLNLLFRMCLSQCLAAAGRYQDATIECQHVLEMDENFATGHTLLACNLIWREMFNDAVAAAAKGYSLIPWNTVAAGVFAAALRLVGDGGRAEELVEQLRNTPTATRGLLFYYLLCGDIENAAYWVEKTVEERDPYGAMMSVFFRSSSQWAALAKMMNFPA